MKRSHNDYFPVFFDLEGNSPSPFLALDQMVAKTNRHPFTIIGGLERKVPEVDVALYKFFFVITGYRDNILPV
jgi:hypothetical protein